MMSCDNTVMPNLAPQSPAALPGTVCCTLGLQLTDRVLPDGNSSQEQQEDAGAANVRSSKSAGQTFPLHIEGKLFQSSYFVQEYSNHFPILTKQVQFLPGVPSCNHLNHVLIYYLRH